MAVSYRIVRHVAAQDPDRFVVQLTDSAEAPEMVSIQFCQIKQTRQATAVSEQQKMTA